MKLFGDMEMDLEIGNLLHFLYRDGVDSLGFGVCMKVKTGTERKSAEEDSQSWPETSCTMKVTPSALLSMSRENVCKLGTPTAHFLVYINTF